MAEAARRLIGAAALAAAALAPAAAAGQAFQITGSCRDGLPHGAYALRQTDGTLRVAGAFNRGKRTSSFIFWSAAGVRIAHVPYDEGRKSGTLSLWYANAPRGGEPQQKQEAGFAADQRNGETRSWHANGRKRARFVYERGVLVEAQAWGVAGATLSEAAARALAERDAEADAQYYATLDAIVDANPPRCDETPPPRTAGARHFGT